MKFNLEEIQIQSFVTGIVNVPQTVVGPIGITIISFQTCYPLPNCGDPAVTEETFCSYNPRYCIKDPSNNTCNDSCQAGGSCGVTCAFDGIGVTCGGTCGGVHCVDYGSFDNTCQGTCCNTCGATCASCLNTCQNTCNNVVCPTDSANVGGSVIICPAGTIMICAEPTTGVACRTGVYVTC